MKGGDPVHVVAERFIELVVTQHYRPLTEMEKRELHESYQWLVNRQWKVARLKNLSYVAHITGDTEWQHEICRELERLGEM